MYNYVHVCRSQIAAEAIRAAAFRDLRTGIFINIEMLYIYQHVQYITDLTRMPAGLRDNSSGKPLIPRPAKVARPV